MSSRKRTLNLKISVKVKCVFNSISATRQSAPRGSEYSVFAFDNNANFLKQPLHFRRPSRTHSKFKNFSKSEVRFQLGLGDQTVCSERQRIQRIRVRQQRQFSKAALAFPVTEHVCSNSSDWYNPQANFQLSLTPPAFMWFAHFSKDIFVSFIYVAHYWHIPLLSTIILSTGNVSVNILTDGVIAFPYSSEWSFLGCFRRAEKGNLLTGKVKRLQLRSFGCMAWL